MECITEKKILSFLTFNGNRITYKGRDVLFSNANLKSYSDTGGILTKEYTKVINLIRLGDITKVEFPYVKLYISIYYRPISVADLEVFKVSSVTEENNVTYIPMEFSRDENNNLTIKNGALETTATRWDYLGGYFFPKDSEVVTGNIQSDITIPPSESSEGLYFINYLEPGYDQVQADVNFTYDSNWAAVPESRVYFENGRWKFKLPKITVHYGEKPETIDSIQYQYMQEDVLDIFL